MPLSTLCDAPFCFDIQMSSPWKPVDDSLVMETSPIPAERTVVQLLTQSGVPKRYRCTEESQS